LIIGDSKIIEDTIFDLKNNPLLGYDVKVWLKNLQGVKSEELKKLIFENKIEKIVLSTKNWQENFFQDFFPQLFSLGVEVSNFVEFFESVYQKTPLEEIDGNQLIEQIKIPDRIYDFLKRIIDIILALFLIIIFIPFMLVSICLIKISSPKESVFFKQKRVGQYNKPFVIYKLRTMITQAEKEGPLWTEENDKRITKLGKILRRLYLDETPQLYNILKGELSFVGPRPERIELVQLYQKLPYYHLRHLIKPGLTGWAQINYKPSASVEEAFEKLKYDIYYLKHRSLILDLLIILKTIRLFF
jgi:exopolysaccharide biosynthesis polyprenyl glycosylphosphotransferase